MVARGGAQRNPWKRDTKWNEAPEGDGTFAVGSVAPPGLVRLVGFASQGLRSLRSLHPRLPSSALPGLKRKT